MCFSAEASYAAAAVLIPAGAVAIRRAAKVSTDYVPIAALRSHLDLSPYNHPGKTSARATLGQTVASRIS